ncbi:Innexin inx2 [Armadillidium nasatum]|uniref:Innexin n=1 Tax=Armadillidium nasatum TaxID=96803 RepID=A0A5N5T6X4_9CRUS|nr:Innexin inx2 [Armadillidium nasatum]
MSVIKHFSPLAAFVKSPDVGTRTCESLPFKLQCYITTGILIASSILIGSYELFGSPIMCMSSLPKKPINNYCWVATTFTMDDYSFREVGDRAVAPGVGSPDAYDDEAIQERWTYHNYYQWVVAVLVLTESEVVTRKREVVNYFLSHLRLHNFYFFAYLFCEFLCLVIVSTIIFYFNKFLGNAFLDYGINVMDFTEKDQTERVDPMIFVFPRQTKCIFHMFGASGTIERRDAFCLLPQNIINEKVFILLWFWLFIQLVLLLFLFVYRFVIVVWAGLRFKILELHAKYVPNDVLETIIKKGSIGDWWVFYQLTSKIEPYIYKDILCCLARELERTNSNSREHINQNSNGYIANGGAFNGHPHGYYPNVNPQLASAPPAGFAQSSV